MKVALKFALNIAAAAVVLLHAAVLSFAAEPVHLWIEAEHTLDHNMPGFLYNPEGQPKLSGNVALIAHTSTPPGEEGYFVRYEVAIPAAGEYTVWINGTRNDSIWTSPFSWRIDSGAWNDMRGVEPVGGAFGPWDAFGWTRVGPLYFEEGSFTLEIRVVDPRAVPGEDPPLWVFYMDAILITNDAAFIPSGIEKP